MQKTSCPYTYRQLTENHRGWCGRVKGPHCGQHPCPWKDDNFRDATKMIEDEDKPAVMQRTLW